MLFNHRDMLRLKERLDLLTGTRGAVSDRQLAAIRRADVAGLAQLNLTAEPAAGDPPTKAEYDALVADVRMIGAALVALGGA